MKSVSWVGSKNTSSMKSNVCGVVRAEVRLQGPSYRWLRRDTGGEDNSFQTLDEKETRKMELCPRGDVKSKETLCWDGRGLFKG